MIGIDQTLRRRNGTPAVERSDGRPLPRRRRDGLGRCSRGCRRCAPRTRHSTRTAAPPDPRSDHAQGSVRWRASAEQPPPPPTTARPAHLLRSQRARPGRCAGPTSPPTSPIAERRRLDARGRSPIGAPGHSRRPTRSTRPASAHTTASRAKGDHVCPTPPATGLPTMNTSTAGTAVKASSAATSAPATSVARVAQGIGA